MIEQSWKMWQYFMWQHEWFYRPSDIRAIAGTNEWEQVFTSSCVLDNSCSIDVIWFCNCLCSSWACSKLSSFSDSLSVSCSIMWVCWCISSSCNGYQHTLNTYTQLKYSGLFPSCFSMWLQLLGKNYCPAVKERPTNCQSLFWILQILRSICYYVLVHCQVNLSVHFTFIITCISICNT